MSASQGLMSLRDLAQLISPGTKTAKAGTRLNIQCPAHEDRTPSLTIWHDTRGKVALNCHAGCAEVDIHRAISPQAMEYIRSTWPDTSKTVIFPTHKPTPPPATSNNGTIGYEYVTENGELSFVVKRGPNKEFKQYRHHEGRLIAGRGDTPSIPYRLPDVIAANKAGDPIFVVEGEKDADKLAGLGLTATCNPGGAGNWSEDLSSWFVGAERVIIVPDNDDAGRGHAEKVLKSLEDLVDSLTVLELPNLPEKGDVSDWIEAGGTAEQLIRLAEATPATRGPRGRLEVFPLSDLLAMDMTAPEWLIEGIWPRDAYGAIGAIYKAGKTWLSADLVISVASGGQWCNKWPTPSGPVLMFLGEGGRRKMRRRLEAVARHKGIDLTGLDIHLSVIPPNLTDHAVIAEIFETVERIGPRLVLIDPLYLSAPGVQLSSIVEVGTVLREIQQVTDRYMAALVLVHHWNQTGKGTGAERFSGAGVAEWGRVLVSVDARTVEESETFSDVLVSLEITGDEVADQKSSFRRRISVDGDASDLAAPFHYQIEEQAIPQRIKSLKKPNTRDLILGLLESGSAPISAGEMSQRFASWGHQRKADTISKEAEKLVSDGDVDRIERDTITAPHLYLIQDSGIRT